MIFYLVLFVAVLLAAMIWSVPTYLMFNFGKVTFDQVLFFLTTEDGTMGTDRLVLLSALQILVLKPLVFALLTTGLMWLAVRWVLRLRLRHWHRESPRESFVSRPFFVSLAVGGVLTLPFVSAYSTMQTLGGVEFFSEHEGPDEFAKRYVSPPVKLELAGSASARPRNLILLYVESLETTFSDEDHFAVDLNAPLHPLFTRQPLGIEEMAGTNWTTAGMIASQCAVPLATFIWNKAEFKPGAMLGNTRCLGDYLADLGYRQYFLVGPDLKFSGMDKFYRNHGYQYTFGKQELLEAGMPEDKLTGWGGSVNDDTLLDLALEQILALYASTKEGGRPFNVTVITTDNHAPDGYLSPRCPPSDLSPAFARVIDCTNRSVARFYEGLKKAGVLEETVFVVMGDHLFMNNPEQDHYFPPREERRVFFNYHSPGGEVCGVGLDNASAKTGSSPGQPVELPDGSPIAAMTHFDVAPTILALVSGSPMSQMGLGDNLCQPIDFVARQARHAVLKSDIASHSQAYRALW